MKRGLVRNVERLFKRQARAKYLPVWLRRSQVCIDWKLPQQGSEQRVARLRIVVVHDWKIG